MATSPTITPAVAPPPKTNTPRTLGLLNIIFGSLLLVMGMGQVMNLVMMPFMGAMM
jgi:hypothetical protein